MSKWLERWANNITAGWLDGELIVASKPMIQRRVLTLDEIFNNGGRFREANDSNDGSSNG
jgi:hypothetical protein